MKTRDFDGNQTGVCDLAWLMKHANVADTAMMYGEPPLVPLSFEKVNDKVFPCVKLSASILMLQPT